MKELPRILVAFALCVACVGLFLYLGESPKLEKINDEIEEAAPKNPRVRKRFVPSNAPPASSPSAGEEAPPPPKMADSKAAETAYQNDIAEAIARYRSGDLDEAINQLRALVENNPARDDAEALLGELFEDIGDYSEAYVHLRRALDLNPANSRALLLLPEVLENPLANSPPVKGDVYELYKEWETEQNSPALQLGLAKLEAADKNLASALARFEEAGRSPDLFVEASVEASVAYLKHGQAEKALELYARNIESQKSRGEGLPEDWEDLRLNYASTLLELKKFDEAQKQLEALEAEKPGVDTAWLHKSLHEARGS